MSRWNLFSVSLVAAIPAFVLWIFLALSWFSGGEKMETMFRVMAGLLWLASLLVWLTPVGILVFSPKDSEAASQADVDETETETETDADDDDDVEAEDSQDDLNLSDAGISSDELEPMDESADDLFDDDDAFESGEFESGEFETGEFETGEFETEEIGDDFGLDEFEDEDEEE